MTTTTTTARLARGAAAALALAAGLSACTDVTVEPRSVISPANVFDDPTAYRALLAKAYGGLALSGPEGPGSSDIQGIDAGFGQYLRVLWVMQELPTDEAILAWNDQSAGVQDINTQRWTPSNGSVTALYARILLQATLANEFLRQTTDAQLNARGATAGVRATVQTYRAEARFLRALSYWHAVDLYGAAPLLTEDSPIGGAAPAAATRQQLFDFVVSELQAIRPNLLVPRRSEAAQYGRATQAAADMLLAKVLMNAQVYTGTARYAEALAATQRVIDAAAAGGFSIDPNYQRMFLADNHTSPELLYTVPQDGARTQNFGGTTFLAHASFGDNTGGVEVTRDLGLNGGWYGLRARPELGTLFTGLAADKRGGVQTGVQAILFTPGQERLSLTRTVDNFGEGYRVHKYRNVTQAGVGGSDQTFVDIDYPMFRLGDAYLMYAEGVTRGAGGSRATALGYVNALRARAGSPAITDAQLTTNFLLDERARELFWEGHRRTDLIRFGVFTGAGKLWQFKGGVQNGTATDAKYNLYPIPAAERAANPNLPQNPGF
jgi:hypothetical protein